MACKPAVLALALLALAGCGGGLDEAAEPEAVAVPSRAANGEAPAARDTTAPGELRREVFAYSGGPRDPFESLLETALVGPELPDLTLVAVYLDHRDADRSVAVLRERVNNRRYNVHAGDRLGRLRVAAIRDRAVDFIVDDFGTERRETLSLRRPQEEQTP